MLVLTRKASQKIHIGDDITVTVVRIDGNKVRIGIEAPHGVPIIREELLHGEPLSAGELAEVLIHS